MTWINGENGNRASIELWGSEEAARASLATLTNCSYCSDCSYCSKCSDCSYCSDCSDCSYCSECSPQKTSIEAIPAIKDIHKKVYESASKPDCLNMATWHSCETTHCRAGWVVHLAGEAGYALEKRTDPVFAAMQIYKASGYEISPGRFYDSNDKALEDMKRLAGA